MVRYYYVQLFIKTLCMISSRSLPRSSRVNDTIHRVVAECCLLSITLSPRLHNLVPDLPQVGKNFLHQSTAHSPSSLVGGIPL